MLLISAVWYTAPCIHNTQRTLDGRHITSSSGTQYLDACDWTWAGEIQLLEGCIPSQPQPTRGQKQDTQEQSPSPNGLGIQKGTKPQSWSRALPSPPCAGCTLACPRSDAAPSCPVPCVREQAPTGTVTCVGHGFFPPLHCRWTKLCTIATIPVTEDASVSRRSPRFLPQCSISSQDPAGAKPRTHAAPRHGAAPPLAEPGRAGQGRRKAEPRSRCVRARPERAAAAGCAYGAAGAEAQLCPRCVRDGVGARGPEGRRVCKQGHAWHSCALPCRHPRLLLLGWG